MEGIFLVLIGAALFSQSWYVLGMYSEGRSMGIFVAGLGVLSLATLSAAAFVPLLLTKDSKRRIRSRRSTDFGRLTPDIKTLTSSATPIHAVAEVEDPGAPGS